MSGVPSAQRERVRRASYAWAAFPASRAWSRGYPRTAMWLSGSFSYARTYPPRSSAAARTGSCPRRSRGGGSRRADPWRWRGRRGSDRRRGRCGRRRDRCRPGPGGSAWCPWCGRSRPAGRTRIRRRLGRPRQVRRTARWRGTRARRSRPTAAQPRPPPRGGRRERRAGTGDARSLTGTSGRGEPSVRTTRGLRDRREEWASPQGNRTDASPAPGAEAHPATGSAPVPRLPRLRGADTRSGPGHCQCRTA